MCAYCKSLDKYIFYEYFNKEPKAIKISAIGTGLAAIFGAGSVLLAVLNNPAWSTFMWGAIIALVASILLRKL